MVMSEFQPRKQGCAENVPAILAARVTKYLFEVKVSDNFSHERSADK